MNKLKYFLVASFLVGIVSCKKTDLELYPYNQIETTQAFNTEADVTLAVNGMYSGLRAIYVDGVTNIMGDVLADNLIINQQGRLTLKTFGEWRYTGEDTWGLMNSGYAVARRANAILENIDKFPAGAFHDNSKAEALATRALVYFDMVRVYSKTYQNASATDSTMPYITITESTNTPSKEPVKGFYDKVIKDLEDAKTLVGATTTVYRWNKPAIAGLLSRVYLYKGDWAKTISSATEALGAAPSVGTRAEFAGIWTDVNSTAGGVVTSPGVLFKIQNTVKDNFNTPGVNYYQTVSGERKSEYVVPSTVKSLFTSTDIRLSTYISTSTFNGVSYNNVIKYAGRPGGVAGVVDAKIIRTAEVVLNRAEAYFRSGNEPLARQDLILLKQNRYSSYDPTQDNALTGQALLNEILLQRRLELAFEGDRFWDLKRLNLPVLRNPTVGDRSNGSGTPYVYASLAAGDYRFQLPFPIKEINFNTNFKQNPGY